MINIDDFEKLEGDDLGSATFELGDIVGSKHNMKIMNLITEKGEYMGKCICRLDLINNKQKKLINL